MSARTTPGPFLRTFAEAASPVLRERMRADRCLNATRIFLEVMAIFGVRAEPLSVRTLAVNKQYFDEVRALRRWPNSKAETDGIIERGGWSVAVGAEDTPEDPGGWNGHLVALAQGFLIDASAIQLTREGKGILLPDILVTGPLPSRFLKGKDPLHVPLEAAGRVVYWARLEDRSYEHISGFSLHRFNAEITVEIADAMAEKLQRPPPFIPYRGDL